MSKKTFYQVFESKEALVDELIERFIGEARSDVEKITGGDGGFIQKLHGVMGTIALRLSSIGKPFQQDIQRHLPHIWEKIASLRRIVMTENFTRLIRQGKEEGVIRSDVNSDILLMIYLGAIEAVIHPTVLAAHPFSASDAIQSIVRILFTGVLTEEGCTQFNQMSRNTLPQ